MLLGWLAMTIAVSVATMLQGRRAIADKGATSYTAVGAIAGMTLGLIVPSSVSSPATLYSIMILTTALGSVFGFLLYSNTPSGRPCAPGSGRFASILMAKGFPAAVTVMMPGMALTLAIATLLQK